MSVTESSISSSSIISRSSSDGESLSWTSSISPHLKKKDAGPKIDLSGPGLRSRSLGLPDLRPDMTWGFPDTLDLQVRSRSQGPGRR